MFGYSEITRRLTAIEYRLREMDVAIIEVMEKMDRVWFAVNRPHSLGVTILKEDSMIRFGMILPVRPANDDDWAEISNGRLTVKVGEGEEVILLTGKGDQLTEDRVFKNDLFVGNQGDRCEATFCYIDNAGNLGSKVGLSFTLVDTVPPVGPTALGVAMLEEIPDPAPEPQPDDIQPIPDTPPVDGTEPIA